jgi:hypothetical protein
MAGIDWMYALSFAASLTLVGRDLHSVVRDVDIA